MKPHAWSTAALLANAACLVDVAVAGDAGTGVADTVSSSGVDTSGATTAADTASSTGPHPSDSSSGGPKFDVAPGLDAGVVPLCQLADRLDAPGTCRMHAPADSFTPEVQWSWPADLGGTPYWLPRSGVTPLVANLTDDDGNGSVDPCDTPDVVLVTQRFTEDGLLGELHIIDGATGSTHLTIGNIDPTVIPALGDIDGDARVDIVAGVHDDDAIPPEPLTPDRMARLGAFAADGTTLWTSPVEVLRGQGLAVALADIDHDDDVEIVVDRVVLDHTGALVWSVPEPDAWCPPWMPILDSVCKLSATAIADLDGDDDMEIILGPRAYRADGTEYWDHPELTPGFPQVANLDADPMPEVLLVTQSGLSLLEHDGAISVLDARPTADTSDNSVAWFRPAAIHDFDGDGAAEIAVSSLAHYSVIESDFSVAWTASVQDLSGFASGTAFDFLGDGRADAIYADETNLRVFDQDGTALFDVPRVSPTYIEYPVVADIDNDGSAEILVVSWSDGSVAVPALQAIRDVDDRWVPARRIWNQHTYHVTNVREDGTIPRFEPRSWETLNTYRTNAQIEGAEVCIPAPAG